MEYNGGSYGSGPYDDGQDARGGDPYDPRYRGGSAPYGADPNAYGADPNAYGADPNAYGGYAPADPSAGGYYAPRGASGRVDMRGGQEQGDGYYAPRGASGRVDMRGGQEQGDGYYAPRGASGRVDMRGGQEQGDGYYAPRGASGRVDMREGQEQGDGYYASRGASGRVDMRGQEQGDGYYAPRGASGRVDMRDRDADSDERYSDEDEPRRAPKRSKKKRSKFSRFMRGMARYLAQMPTKTLVVIGGSIAAVIVAVILLVVLLPQRAKSPDATDGTLSIADVPTPTPSLAPTDVPVTTDTPEPTTAPDPLNGVTISVSGDTNDAIPAVQERLVELGYMDMPEGGYTNKYGPATKTGIRLFQVKNIEDYHDWDGVLGSQTYALLMSETAQPYYLKRGDGDGRTKDITKLVQDVTKLQNRLVQLGYLTGSATGMYGESTVNAVLKFQQYHGLKMDGVAGQSTLLLVYSSDAMDAKTGAANDKSKLSPTPGATTPASVIATTPAP